MNPFSVPILKSERLLLRKISIADLPNIYKGLSNPEVANFFGDSYTTLKQTEEQLHWFKKLEKDKTGIWWAICSLDNKIFYGTGGFHELEKEHRKSEIGFWLLPEFWGQGIIKEAVQLICDFGFNTLHLNRIEAFVESDNLNCKHAMEKLKFIFEGTMRESELKDGKYISFDIFSKLRSDS